MSYSTVLSELPIVLDLLKGDFTWTDIPLAMLIILVLHQIKSFINRLQLHLFQLPPLFGNVTYYFLFFSVTTSLGAVTLFSPLRKEFSKFIQSNFPKEIQVIDRVMYIYMKYIQSVFLTVICPLLLLFLAYLNFKMLHFTSGFTCIGLAAFVCVTGWYIDHLLRKEVA